MVVTASRPAPLRSESVKTETAGVRVLRGEREAVEQEAIGVSGEKKAPDRMTRASPKAGIDVNATY